MLFGMAIARFSAPLETVPDQLPSHADVLSCRVTVPTTLA
jgi:hypothetical protein